MCCTVMQSSFTSSNGQNKINYYIYQPSERTPKGIVQISHGMCEHFLRYDEFARFLVEKGFVVCGNDHIGHGYSVSRENDLGYFAKSNGYQILVNDIHILTKLIKKNYPDLPLFLLGHSMGSFIVRAYLDQFSSEIDGVIISGTSGKNSMLAFGITFAKMIKNFHGDHYRSELLKKMVNAGYNSRYQEHYSENDWLTKDKKMIDLYEADPKCSFTFTISAYLDLFELLELVSKNSWGNGIRRDLPIYLFSGTDDPVGNFSRGVKQVYRHLLNIRMENVSMRLYDKGRHEMLNETNKMQVYQNVLRWLDKQLTQINP